MLNPINRFEEEDKIDHMVQKALKKLNKLKQIEQLRLVKDIKMTKEVDIIKKAMADNKKVFPERNETTER